MSDRKICAQCGRTEGQASFPCSSCADYATRVTKTCLPEIVPGNHGQGQNQAQAEEGKVYHAKVVDAEVLGPDEPMREGGDAFRQWAAAAARAQQRGEGAGNEGGQRMQGQFFSWQSAGGQNIFATTRKESCLPGAVTLAIMLTLGARLGFLAALGFVVFYAVGSGLGFLATVQRAMRGQRTNPWLPRIAVWCGAAALTVLLAGGWG